MQINWTAVLLGLGLAIAAWFIPNPFTDSCPPMPEQTVNRVQGIADTSYLPKPVVSSHEFGKSKQTKVNSNLSDLDSSRHGLPVEYNVYEATLDSVINKDTLTIRSRTYVDSKVGDAFTDIEFSLRLEPTKTIHSVDTVFSVIQLPCPELKDASVWDSPLKIAEIGVVGFAIGALVAMIGIKN